MDSEVQSNASATSKNSSKKLTSLYNQIEKRSKGAEEVKASKKQSKEDLQPIFEKLKRHRNELDRFNGMLQRMGTALLQNDSRTTVEDYSSLSEAILLMKEQSQTLIDKVSGTESDQHSIIKRLDAIEATKDHTRQEAPSVSDDMQQKLGILEQKVQEMSAIESKVEILEKIIEEWREMFKKKAKKVAKSWIETPTLEDSIKAGQTEDEKEVSMGIPPAIEQNSSKPNDSHNREEVQQEIGTVDASVNT